MSGIERHLMSELYRTAPETIYLCVSDLDPEFCEDDAFPQDHDGVTWSTDKPVNGTVEYRKVVDQSGEGAS